MEERNNIVILQSQDSVSLSHIGTDRGSEKVAENSTAKKTVKQPDLRQNAELYIHCDLMVIHIPPQTSFRWI